MKRKTNKTKTERGREREKRKKTVFCFWLIKKCELFNVPIKMGINCVANVSITQSVEQIVDAADVARVRRKRERQMQRQRERRRDIE